MNLCHVKTNEYKQAKQRLFLKSIRSSITTPKPFEMTLNDDPSIASVPSIRNDDDNEFPILFKVIGDNVDLYQDIELKHKFVGMIMNDKFILCKDQFVYGKYINPKTVQLENGFYCLISDVIEHHQRPSNNNNNYLSPTTNDSGSDFSYDDDEREISKSYKERANEVLRLTKDNISQYMKEIELSSNVLSLNMNANSDTNPNFLLPPLLDGVTLSTEVEDRSYQHSLADNSTAL